MLCANDSIYKGVYQARTLGYFQLVGDGEEKAFIFSPLYSLYLYGEYVLLLELKKERLTMLSNTK